MHDEFRVQINAHAPGEVLDALKSIQVSDEAHQELPRLAITHEGDHVYVYADSAGAAAHAREVLQHAIAERSLTADATVMRWHPLEERWEDASAPLPATDAERAVEHERLEQVETEESLQSGAPEWEVYITLPTHHDARAFAKRLRDEGIPTKQLWHHLLVGANDEDDAAALAKRLQAEAPAGSQLHPQANGMAYWRMLHPYAYLGGLGN
jgi:hypothetical protein